MLTPQTEYITLLIQAGIAGVFAVFAIVLVREFIKYLTRRDVADRTQRAEIMIAAEKSLSELTLQIAHLTEIVISIRAEVRSSSKTQPLKKAG